jgi:hypothetical protein
MNKWMVRIGAVVLVCVMAFSAVSAVNAQGPGGRPGADGPQDRVAGTLLRAVTEATGLGPQDVLRAMRDGQTLAAICEANDADPAAVTATAKAQLTADINAALDEGKITPEQAEQALGRLDAALDRAMNFSRLADGGRGRDLGRDALGALVGALAEQTGLEPSAILQAARNGQTLADIATANGVDPQAVIDAALAATDEHLQQAVDEGKITPEQKADLLARASEFYANVIDQPLPERPTPVQDRVQESLERTLVGVLAEMAGVDTGDLLKEALTPPTLAEIAASQGVDPDAVIDEAEARITTRVNELVDAGTLTPEQAAQMLDGLRDRLERRFDAPLRDLRPSNRPGGSGRPGNRGPGGQGPAAGGLGT